MADVVSYIFYSAQNKIRCQSGAMHEMNARNGTGALHTYCRPACSADGD